MKQFIKRILEADLSIKLLEKYNAGLGSIFMLHRVGGLEGSILTSNRDLFISPEFLESLIYSLKKKNYSFISIDEIQEILIKNRKAKKVILFTLDDGYLDNFSNAYPIFKALSIPFTLYLTTSFLEKKVLPWWYSLEQLLVKHTNLKLADGSIICASTIAEKEIQFIKLRKLIMFGKHHPQTNFLNLFINYTNDINSFSSQNLFLSWEHVQIMSKDDITTIGAHTVTHPVLKNVNKSELINELSVARSVIEEKLGKPINHIAYPFGGINEISSDTFNHAKAIGYKTGVTTLTGNIFKENVKNLLALPRIFLNESVKPQEIKKVMYVQNFILNSGRRIVEL